MPRLVREVSAHRQVCLPDDQQQVTEIDKTTDRYRIDRVAGAGPGCHTRNFQTPGGWLTSTTFLSREREVSLKLQA
jgi:hypothetical protein